MTTFANTYKHKTRDGRVIKLYEMEDDHLTNFIDYLLKKLQQARNLIDNSTSEFNRAMYGTSDIEAAKNFVKYFMTAFPFYFMELGIRNSELTAEYGKQVSEIIGRSTRIDTSIFQRLIESEDEHYETVDDF